MGFFELSTNAERATGCIQDWIFKKINIEFMRNAFFILAVFFISDTYGQVNLQTGSANYNIPIFSYGDSKSGLSTSVSLNYSSGNGLIVGSRASNTGQNWNLIAGGAIFRKQNGEPDDQNSTGLFPVMPNGNSRGFNNEIACYDEDYQSFSWAGDPYSRDYIDNYFPNGYQYSEFGLGMVENNQSNWPEYLLAPRELAIIPRFKANMDKKWKLSRRSLADREQDSYFYNFNGQAGEFVIGKDGNIVLINDSKIIIDKTTLDLTAQNILTRISEFTIKDNNGFIYKFSAFELSENMKFMELSNEGPNNFKKYVNSSEPTGKFTIQGWLLTEILNPITQEKIQFEYEDYDVDIITSKAPCYQFDDAQYSQSVQVNEQRSRSRLKRLKNILLPDGHKVEFEYTNFRFDVPQDYMLSTIRVLYNGEEINSYSLNYGYMVKKQIKGIYDVIPEDQRFARLCLLSVQKNGTAISEPPFQFEYYTGADSPDPKDLVPPFDCMAQDHWGYYNKSSIVDIEDSTPSKEVLKDLMLNNTTYR
ncbi:MAG: hypothetical protein KDC56_00215, partial [Flavobacteriaceae bacterium]|nr:hypothetical protein [Flavobacteriaceae bacterium]